jgi:type I restriction enzyme S subunit
VANVQRGYLDLEEIKEIEATEDEITDLRLLPGDILLIEGGNREHLGRGWIWQGEIGECIHQNHIFRARLRDPEIEPRFCSWYANHVGQGYFHAEASQTVNLASINLTKLSGLPVAVPPLAEQKRIVAKVEALLARVNAAWQRLAKVPAILKCFRQSVLAAACAGRLTTDWRARASPNESVSETLDRIESLRRQEWEARQRARSYRPSAQPLPWAETELPSEWKWTTVSQVARLDVGFAFKSKEYADKGIPLLRGENIEPGSLRWHDVRFWPKERLNGFEHLLVEDGEIILALDRPIIASGLKIARARPDDVPCLLVQRMMRFKVYDPTITCYLYLCLLTQSFLDSLQNSTTGSDLPHITGTGIAGFTFPFPPLAEQREIVRRVEALFRLADAIGTRVAAATARAEKLTQAILAKAFRGELVPTEAELARREGRPYEPASALLDRIRAERAAVPAPRKRPARRRTP